MYLFKGDMGAPFFIETVGYQDKGILGKLGNCGTVSGVVHSLLTVGAQKVSVTGFQSEESGDISSGALVEVCLHWGCVEHSPGAGLFDAEQNLLIAVF